MMILKTANPIDVLVIVPRAEKKLLVKDNRYDFLSANYYIPYYLAYLRFCRKIGIEINIAKKKIKIPTHKGIKFLEPNNNPSHTAMVLSTILDYHKFRFYVIDPPFGFPKSAKNELRKQLRQKPKILAISTTYLISTVIIKQIIRLARKYSPGIKIMVGGQYLFTNKDCLYELKQVDLFLKGECEDNLVPTVTALLKSDYRALEKIKGITFRKNGRLVQTPPSPPVDLDKTLLINWSLMYDFFPRRSEIKGNYVIEDGRGCAFSCSYCSFRKNFHYRLKSVERIIRELKAFPDQFKNINIFFTASTFTYPVKRAMDISRRIIEEKITNIYTAFARVGDINEALVKQLKAANFAYLIFGLESLNQTALKLARKNCTADQIKEAVSITSKAGIFTDCSFIVGLPGESAASIKEIGTFIQKPYVDRYCLNPLVDMDSADLGIKPEAFHFERKNLANWKHPDMNSKEVPQLIVDIMIEADKTNNAYSLLIVDSLNGNHLSAGHMTSAPPGDLKPFYVMMEKGTVMYLQNYFKGIKIDRDRLQKLLVEVKNNYLSGITLPHKIVEFARISIKIFLLKIIRLYQRQQVRRRG